MIIISFSSTEPESHCDLRQVGERVRCEHLTLNNGKVDCYLIEPTGMDRGMDQDQVWRGQREPLARGLPTMGRPVVHHPEEPLTRAGGCLVHHLIHESPKRLDPGVWFATSHNVSTATSPPRQVWQRAAPLVLECDVGRPPGSGWQAWMAPDPGLDTGLLIGTHNVILGAQRLARPQARVQLQDAPSFIGAERITGKTPVLVLPGFGSIGRQNGPDRTPADRLAECLVSATRQIRQRLAAQGLMGLRDQLTRQGFDNGLLQRGKKRRDALAPVHPPARSPPGSSGAASAVPNLDGVEPSALLRHGRAGAVHAAGRRAPRVGAPETEWSAGGPSGELAPEKPRENMGGRSVRDQA